MYHNEFLANIFYSELPEYPHYHEGSSNNEAKDDDEGIITISLLEGLIKQNRNAQLKSILLREKLLPQINKRESTLLHTAVIFDNVDVVTLLCTLEFDINARNSLGETPLLVAARNNSYRAAQILLTLGANIFAKDDNIDEHALAVFLKKENNTPVFVIGSLFERLKTSELGSSGIVDILVEFDCPLEHLVLFNDARITREMLNRRKYIDEDTYTALLHSAMLSRDMANVRVLLSCGPDVSTLRRKFIEKITKNIHDPASRPFFERLLKWNLVDSAFLDKADRIFRKADENAIELLLDIGIAEYSQARFRRNLMINLFYNKKIDVAKLLKHRHFDVNSTDAAGVSALRRAIQRGNKAGVMYLLENGADPNIRDRNGRTAIFDCGTDEMRKLLLEAGADLFVIDNDGRTIIDKHSSELIKADYCILEAKRSMDKSAPRIKFSLNSVLVPYREDVQWMKSRKITDSVNLLSVLVDNFEETARRVKTKIAIAAVLKASRERQLKPIYSSRLKKNLKEIMKMYELKLQAAAFLSELIRVVPPDHLAIEKIISFLTYQDLMVFDQIDE